MVTPIKPNTIRAYSGFSAGKPTQTFICITDLDRNMTAIYNSKHIRQPIYRYVGFFILPASIGHFRKLIVKVWCFRRWKVCGLTKGHIE